MNPCHPSPSLPRALGGALPAWGLVGLALGLVSGARLGGANPSLHARDTLIAALVLGAAGALAAVLVGLLATALSHPLGRAHGGSEAPFRRALVAAVGFGLVACGGLALASSTGGTLVTGALALLAAGLLSVREPRPAALGGLVLAGVAVALLGTGYSVVGAYGREPRAEYEPFLAPFAPPPGPVVLVGIDGADWRRVDALLAQGRLPTLAGLLERGVRAPLATTTPTWSPILWTTIATGTLAAQHGVFDFAETPLPGIPAGLQRLRKSPLVPEYSGLRTLFGSLYDLGWLKEQPISARHRRVKALWNVVSDVGGRVAVVNWFATWPSEPVRGALVSDRNPKRAAFLLERQHLEYERTWGVTYPPELLEELLDLETPEVAPDPQAELALPVFADLSPEQRAELAADAELLGVFRHIYESDGFALSAARRLLERGPVDFAAVYASGVDNVGHRFRQPGVIDRYYEYVDGLLAGLVAAAGPEASFVVVSDHGFEYEDRAHYAHEHGPDGILILSGPAFRSGARIARTPSIVDVAPTVLALLGIPLAETLDGTPVLEAFEPGALAAHPLSAVASYGTYAPPTGVAASATPDALQDEVMEKLRALGYVAE